LAKSGCCLALAGWRIVDVLGAKAIPTEIGTVTKTLSGVLVHIVSVIWLTRKFIVPVTLSTTETSSCGRNAS
jgi:hypothetical protein